MKTFDNSDLSDAKLPAINEPYKRVKRFNVGAHVVTLRPQRVRVAYAPQWGYVSYTAKNGYSGYVPIYFTANGYVVEIDGKKTGLTIHRQIDRYGGNWRVAAVSGHIAHYYNAVLDSLKSAAIMAYATGAEMERVNVGTTPAQIRQYLKRNDEQWSVYWRAIRDGNEAERPQQFNYQNVWDIYFSFTEKKTD